jgi:hypothetical protein
MVHSQIHSNKKKRDETHTKYAEDFFLNDERPRRGGKKKGEVTSNNSPSVCVCGRIQQAAEEAERTYLQHRLEFNMLL